MRLLAVTAVAAEADAVRAGVGSGGSTVSAGSAGSSVETVVAGIGPAAAAAATSAALAADRYDVVVSTGIAGGFDLPLGTVVVASRIVAADLGVETAAGFEPIGVTALDVPAELVTGFAVPTRATVGAVLSVSTVTGTAATTAALLARHPDAVAEAMEGFGVATAATWHGVPFAEVRAISNTVGPRDRASWRIPAALDALTEAFAAITKEPL